MSCSCSCKGGPTLVLACSGASNVGQLTNDVAKRLDAENSAKFYCLAGPGGDIEPMVTAVKDAGGLLVLDGCPVACAKLIMDRAGVTDYEYVVVTDLGIEKNRDFALPDSQIDQVMVECRARIGSSCQ
jgi:uncharacterized metal-binding protein